MRTLCRRASPVLATWQPCPHELATTTKGSRQMTSTTTMLGMNYWTDKWDLHEDVCPCDVHFNDWVADQGLKNKVIYHFGTGTHHVVGVEQARNGSGNSVLSITAS